MTEAVLCTKCGRYPFYNGFDVCSICWFKATQREKQRDAAKRRRENPRVLACVDIDAAVADLRKVEPLRGLLGRKRIRVDVGHSTEGACGGHAWSKGRKIRVVAGPSATAADVIETVLHELCHVALPRHYHDERFRRVLARVALEAWGVEVSIDVTARWGKIAYGVDHAITEKLKPLITSGAVRTYPPAPKPKLSKAERSAAVVDKRAAHAAVMLAKAERKLKLVKTVHKRWATKVRYYERVAAKRGVRS